MSAAIDHDKQRDERVRKQQHKIEMWSRFTREHLIEALKYMNRREPAVVLARKQIERAKKYARFALQAGDALREIEKEQLRVDRPEMFFCEGCEEEFEVAEMIDPDIRGMEVCGWCHENMS